MNSVTFLNGIFEERHPFGEPSEFVLKSYGTGNQLDEKGREKLDVEKDTEIYLDIHLPSSIAYKDENNNVVVNLDSPVKAKLVASPIPPESQLQLAAMINAEIEPSVTVSRSLQNEEMMRLATLLNQERYQEMADDKTNTKVKHKERNKEESYSRFNNENSRGYKEL